MNRIEKLLLIGLTVSLPTLAAWVPTVQLKDNAVVGVFPKNTQASQQKVHVWKTNDCTATSKKGNRLELSPSCGYLHGVYEYQSKNKDRSQRTFVDFALTRKNKNSYALIVMDPIQINQ